MRTTILATKAWSSLPSGRLTPRDKELITLIDALSSGKVVQIIPEANETPRSLKVLISRRAGRVGISVEYRETPDGFAAKQATS